MKDMVHVLAFVMETSCEKVILWTNVTLQHAKGTSAPSNPRQVLQVILETLPIKTHPKEACSAHTKVTSQSNLIIAPIFFDPDPHQAQAPRSILITSDKNFWVTWRYMCIKQMTKLTLQSWLPIEQKKVILEMCLQQMPPEDKWLPVGIGLWFFCFSAPALWTWNTETKCLCKMEGNPNETWGKWVTSTLNACWQRCFWINAWVAAEQAACRGSFSVAPGCSK